MYYPIDDQGDYAVEGSVADFEPTQEDVLVLQDRDLEPLSLDETVEVLETAFNDLVQLSSLRHAARSMPSYPHLSQLQQCHQRLTKRYGASGLVTESALYAGANMVLVLEKEETQSKGLFVRIWEAICKAFSWVWEKLAGLFATGEEKTDKKAEEADKAAEKLENVTEEMIDLEQALPLLKPIVALYGYLGDLDGPKIVAHGKVLESRITNLKDILGKLNHAYQLWYDFAKSINQDTKVEDHKRHIEDLTKALIDTTSSYKRISKDELLKLAPTGATQNQDIKEAWELDGFSAGQKMVLWQLAPTAIEKTGISYASIGAGFTKKSAAPKVKLTVPVGKDVQAVSDEYNRVWEHYKKELESFEGTSQRNMARSKEAAALKLTEAENAVVKIIGSQGNEVVSCLMVAGRAINDIHSAISQTLNMVTVIPRCMIKNTPEKDAK